MRRIFPTLVSFLLLPGVLTAQEYSYDGNRWYEVEASIFTNDYVPTEHSEIAVPEKARLAYLPRLQELLTRGASFDVEFPGERPLPPASPFSPAPFGPGVVQEEPLPEPVMMGPLHSPAVPDAFHVLDLERDPYIELGGPASQFAAMNRELDGSGQHRVLWHGVWRQPMQGRAQTQAIFTSGGDRQGAHSELEGSLRLSDSGGNVMLDINIWLNRFRVDLPQTDPAWQVPEYPFPPEQESLANGTVVAAGVAAASTTSIVPSEVWQLEQTRELGASQLYYLDHPAFGVLIQIRPYVLPPRLLPEEEVDF